jgi:hypothetical protein
MARVPASRSEGCACTVSVAQPLQYRRLSVDGTYAVWPHGNTVSSPALGLIGDTCRQLPNKNPRFTGILRADEGTRTLDLLHGNPPTGVEAGSFAAGLSQIAAAG